MLPSKLFTIQDNNLIGKNFIYMFNAKCEEELNIFSSNMNREKKKFQLKLNNPELPEDQQEEMDFKYMNLDNKRKYKSKKKIMEKCSEYRFHRADKDRWLLQRHVGNKWESVDETYGETKSLLEGINQDLREPTLVENEEDDFVLIATSTEIQQPKESESTQTANNTQTGNNNQTGNGILKKKTKKTKKVRKHRGIIQTGGSKGKLKKGYRFSGKRLKSGMSEIVKAKKI
jgi:hypothetical protein